MVAVRDCPTVILPEFWASAGDNNRIISVVKKEMVQEIGLEIGLRIIWCNFCIDFFPLKTFLILGS